MSFIGVVEQDLGDVENSVVNGLKQALNYVDNFTTTDLIPELTTVLLAAIEKLGQEAVAKLLGSATTTSTP